MVKKHLTSFEPKDVLRVVLHCEQCGAEVSSAVGGGLSIPPGCPGCRADWQQSKDREYTNATKNFIALLRGFHAEPNSGSEEPYVPPWTVRMVIEEDIGKAP